MHLQFYAKLLNLKTYIMVIFNCLLSRDWTLNFLRLHFDRLPPIILSGDSSFYIKFYNRGYLLSFLKKLKRSKSPYFDEFSYTVIQNVSK